MSYDVVKSGLWFLVIDSSITKSYGDNIVARINPISDSPEDKLDAQRSAIVVSNLFRNHKELMQKVQYVIDYTDIESY